MPPVASESILLYTGELTIQVLKGKQIRDRATFSTMSCYCTTHVKHAKFKSRILHKCGVHPVFDPLYESTFHIENTPADELVKVSMWSAEHISDDLCGTTGLKISDIVARIQSHGSDSLNIWIELRDPDDFARPCGQLQVNFMWKDDATVLRPNAPATLGSMIKHSSAPTSPSHTYASPLQHSAPMPMPMPMPMQQFMQPQPFAPQQTMMPSSPPLPLRTQPQPVLQPWNAQQTSPSNAFVPMQPQPVLQPYASATFHTQPMHQMQHHHSSSSYGTMPFPSSPQNSFYTQPAIMQQQQPLAYSVGHSAPISAPPMSPSQTGAASPLSPSQLPPGARLEQTELPSSSDSSNGVLSDLPLLIRYGGGSGLVLQQIDLFTDSQHRLSGWRCHWLDSNNQRQSGEKQMCGVEAHVIQCKVDALAGERFTQIDCETVKTPPVAGQTSRIYTDELRVHTSRQQILSTVPTSVAAASPQQTACIGQRSASAIKGLKATMRKGKFIEVGIIY